MSVIANWRSRVSRLKRDTYAVYLACRDPRVPWYAKALGAVILAYALSPIDLIPDFIPVLGYFDDLILIPLALWLVMRMIPKPILDEHRARADGRAPRSRAGALVILLVWTVSLALMIWVVLQRI